MSEQYTIRPDKFKDLRNQLLLKKILRILLITALSIGVCYYTMDYNQDNQESLTFWLVCGLSLIGFQAFWLIFEVNKYIKMLKSFKLTISETEVRREMKEMPTIRIRLENVKSISKDKKGNFVIRGNDKSDMIGVPARISHHEQLEESLGQIRAIELKNEIWSQQIKAILYSIVMLIGMGVVYISDNKWLVGICGTITSGLILWSIIQIQRNKNVSDATKTRGYLLMLVLAYIIFITYSKLTVE